MGTSKVLPVSGVRMMQRPAKRPSLYPVKGPNWTFGAEIALSLSCLTNKNAQHSSAWLRVGR
jgi:hypothetical protein